MTMSYWLDRAPPTQLEIHYGDRRVRCFVERPASLHAMLVDAVARAPQREALVCGDRRFDWRSVDHEVSLLAGGLAALGVGAGDRVALLLSNRAEFVLLLLAIARLGAITVPLNIREQTPELAYALAQCGAVAVVFDADLAARLPDANDVPALRYRIAIGDSAPGALRYEALRAGPARHDVAPVREDDVAVILYTSGTTGRPKGAMLTYLGIGHSALHYVHAMRLAEADRCIAAVPLSHVTGLVAMIAAMLACRGTLIVMNVFKAADFLRLAARERVTYTLMVPAMYNLCLLEPDFDTHDLSSWRLGGYGGAPVPPPTIERLAQKLPALALMNAYGATETTSPATLMPPHLTREHGDSVGLAVACAEIRVVDDDGAAVAPGESGEVWIGGPMVVPGYWHNPEATAREFSQGFWHSGDVGALDANGFLRVFDRKKDMINRGGYKVYGAEVEAVLAAHPAVVESAVIGVPCPVLGERVHAFVTLREPSVSADALRAFCAAHVADYKVPETFTLQHELLPRNANGKALKRVLRERLAAERA
jgi:long-chain acyl-CoA synthetase